MRYVKGHEKEKLLKKGNSFIIYKKFYIKILYKIILFV